MTARVFLREPGAENPGLNQPIALCPVCAVPSIETRPFREIADYNRAKFRPQEARFPMHANHLPGVRARRLRRWPREVRFNGPGLIHEGLDAAVSRMLVERCNKRKCGTGLRTTFHRLVPPIHEPQDIEQIVNYAGSGGEGMGRTFPAYAGIAGRAIRTKTPLMMSRQHRTEDKLRTGLVPEWGYTAAQPVGLGLGAITSEIMGHPARGH